MAQPVHELDQPRIGRSLWVALGVIIALGVLALGGIALTTSIAVSGFAKQNTQRQASARTDCRGAISAQFNEVRDRRDNLVAEALLAIDRRDEATLDNIAGAGGQLDRAIASVNGLPDLDDAVDRGYTLDGVKFPPCPKVK